MVSDVRRMTATDPYQPPAWSPPPVPTASEPPAIDPPVVKVLGILHLVLAGIGCLGAVWGLVVALLGNPMLALAGGAGQDPAFQAQVAMQKRLLPMTLTSSALSLLVAVPMIVAGLRLLKRRRDGLKWSNLYAISSLGAKAVNLVLILLIMLPAMREMTRSLAGNAASEVQDVMGGFMAAGAIGGLLISCVYPVVSLVLLNRTTVKEWFASRPA